MTVLLPAPVDPLAGAAQHAAAVEALQALSARARTAAALTGAQALAQRRLLEVDWRGPAAAAFAGVVEQGVAQLVVAVEALELLADDAARRAELLRGSGWRDGVPW